jgi:hypothetical protein
LVALYPVLTIDYFGSRNAAGVIGVLYTGGAAGSFPGPKLAGDAFDRFGSYAIAMGGVRNAYGLLRNRGARTGTETVGINSKV